MNYLFIQSFIYCSFLISVINGRVINKPDWSIIPSLGIHWEILIEQMAKFIIMRSSKRGTSVVAERIKSKLLIIENIILA